MRTPEGATLLFQIVGPRTWFAVLFPIVPTGFLTLILLYYAAQGNGWTHF